MAETCFDMSGVEIKKGDTVELVSTPDPNAGKTYYGQRRLTPGDRIFKVEEVEPSYQFPGQIYVANRHYAGLGHGQWRIVQLAFERERRDAWRPEAPTRSETPAAKSIPPHVHDDFLMGDRTTCGPCHVPPTDTLPDEAWVFAEKVASRRATDPTNPKDAIGSTKAPSCTVPGTVKAELGLAMLEGSLKYGRHNYRAAPVRASVYLDAADRHMKAWWDHGQDVDPDSGLSHLVKAMACYAIVRDAQICGSLIDDRPPPSPIEHADKCNEHAARLVAKYPSPVRPYVAGDLRMTTRDPIEVELDALKRRTAPR